MTDAIEELKRQLAGSRLTEASDADIRELRTRFPDLPEDYIDLLSRLGFGSLGPDRFSIYSGPIEPADIFGESAESLPSLVLIGDDYAGYHIGYITEDVPWRFVAFDHCCIDDPLESDHLSVLSFLHDWFLNPDEPCNP